MDSDKNLIPPGGNQLINANGDDGPRYMTNFKGEGIERWMFISKVTQEKGVKGIEAKNKPIDLVFWYVHEVEIMNERTGELVPAIRTVLVDDKGVCYPFASEGVYNGLRLLVHHMGMGPYIERPVRVVVKEGDTRHGRRYYYLEPFMEKAAS